MTAGRWVRVLAPFVAAIATVSLMSIVAGAHDTDFDDPNDTRGLLDVRAVRLAHQPGPPRWSVITFPRWTIHQIWDRGYVMVLIDTRDGQGPDFYLLVRSVGTALQGTLWQIRSTGPDTYLGTVPVSKPGARSVTVEVGLRRLAFGPTRRFYRWSVQTVFTSATCTNTCQDRAPNPGMMLQWRPGMSPTPTPSPTSSPSPSSGGAPAP